MSDLIVIVANELDRIEVGGCKMPDIQIDFEKLRHGERLCKTFGSSELVWILNVGVAVHGDIYLVLLREGDEAFRNAQLSGSRDDAHAKCVSLIESSIQLFVGKIIPEVHGIGEQ